MAIVEVVPFACTVYLFPWQDASYFHTLKADGTGSFGVLDAAKEAPLFQKSSRIVCNSNATGYLKREDLL